MSPFKSVKINGFFNSFDYIPLALLLQAISFLICIYFHYEMALDMPLFLWSMMRQKWPKIAARKGRPYIPYA
jgi:hypothetical protein